MLYEIRNPRQIPGEPFRRWFYSHEQDLYVWYDDDKQISAFQLCYSKARGERALYWRADKGYSHLRVDDGWRNGTPLLLADGAFDTRRVLESFREQSIQVPTEVREFVEERLQAYRPPVPRKPWWRLW